MSKTMVSGLSRLQLSHPEDDYIFWKSDIYGLLLWWPDVLIWKEIPVPWDICHRANPMSPLDFLVLTGVDHTVAPTLWEGPAPE